MKTKIEQELAEFKEFKKYTPFVQKEILETDDDFLCDGLSLFDEAKKLVGETNNWINVGYNIKNSQSRCLSNLFPYQFEFKGFQLKSLEAFFQCLKFQDPYLQRSLFDYAGIDAYHIQIASPYNWKESGILYWQGEPIQRLSSLYEDLVDEVYISALQNPLYLSILKKTDKYILHSIGKENPMETVFTRFEFERELNLLSLFLKEKETV